MNEHIQIINNYNPFVITGIVLSCIWAGAYILSWLVQWAWSWVDEGEVSAFNYVAQLSIRSIPKNGWAYVDAYYKYHKYKNGKRVDRQDTKPETDYKISNCSYVAGGFHNYLIILPLIWFSMLCLNYWYISMWFALVIALAYTTRMARRGQKLLTAHIKDKDAHKNVSEV